MKNRSFFLIAMILFIGGYSWLDYYNNHFSNQRIMQNIVEDKDYSVQEAARIKIDFFIKPEWIPPETEEPQKLNLKISESHQTNIVLQQVWNRGDDIYFSFHTTYEPDYDSGNFLHNMLIDKEKGTYTSAGSSSDFLLTDLTGKEIEVGSTGFGPGSDFAVGINSEEYRKIEKGFHISYSGMILYAYSRK
ncbi:hypothetical protein ACLBWT_08995 [Paenibacillus sp. D51F]